MWYWAIRPRELRFQFFQDFMQVHQYPQVSRVRNKPHIAVPHRFAEIPGHYRRNAAVKLAEPESYARADLR